MGSEARELHDIEYDHLCAAFHGPANMTLAVFENGRLEQVVPIQEPSQDLLDLGRNQIAILFAKITTKPDGRLNVVYMVDDIRSFTVPIAQINTNRLFPVLAKLVEDTQRQHTLN